METSDRDTLADRWLRALKNNPLIATAIVVSAIICGIAAFTDSIVRLQKFFFGPPYQQQPSPSPAPPAPTPKFDRDLALRDLKEQERISINHKRDVSRWEQYIDQQKAQILVIKESHPTSDDEIKSAMNNISYCEKLIEEGSANLESARSSLALSDAKVSILRARIAEQP